MTDIEILNRHWRPNGLEAFIEHRGPWDCMHCYVLRGEGLAVHWLYFDNSHLPDTVAALDASMPVRRSYSRPMAMDLGSHSATPMHRDQVRMDECHLLGIPCYYDVSGLDAEPGLAILAEQGDEGIWEWLERYWQQTMADLQANLSRRVP